MFIKRSLTGKFDYFLSDTGLKLVRCDRFNPSQPRDASGKWSRGSFGASGRPSKTAGLDEHHPEVLAKKKLTELQAIAKKVGAKEPIKYRNRKSAWIDEIQTAKGNRPPSPPTLPTPPPPIGTPDHSPEVLGKKKLTELQAIAKEVGAKEPIKYRNRKSAWIDEIQKAKGNKPPLVPIPPEPITPKPLTHQDLINTGKEFADKHLKNVIVSKKEADLMQERSKLAEQFKNETRLAKKNAIADKIIANEEATRKLKEQRLQATDTAFRALEGAIKNQSAISALDAKKLADKISIDSNVPRHWHNEVRDVAANFFQMTGGKGASSITVLVKTDDRAYANRFGTVNVGASLDKNTLFHEFAHHVEYENNDAALAAAKWRDSRATPGTKPDKLSKITGNKDYGDAEIAVQDKFIDPYVGKIYSDFRGNASTEVISMGIEHFASRDSMKRLYEADPDHFHFALGLMLHR